MKRTAVAAAACLALLAGCGLPLPDGVRRPGAVPAQQRLPQPVNVLPPGPQPGASPEEVVTGFLTAQGSARDEHRIARSFLAPAARAGWRAEVGVTVYDSRTTSVGRPAPDGDGVVVPLTIDVLGSVGADGAARVQPAQSRTQRYRLRQEAGQWQLVDVPDGLTLSTAGRDRSYVATSVYFVVPGSGTGGRHLVADLLRLPAEQDRAQQAVERLLAGPSSGLAGSATTAVPVDSRLRTPVATDAAGEVTVDLTGPVGQLSPVARVDLSAQLVWTLKDAVPEFTRLLLLVDGAPLAVPGVGSPQPRAAWGSYTPDGPDSATGLALVGGGLRSLAPADEDDEAPPPADVTGVVDLAVDPRSRSRLAVLTADGSTTTLRTGTLQGPLAAVLQDPGLRSPTWGSGDPGLFLLRTGARPAVLLVPASGGAVEVPVDGLPALDGDAVLRVSRDGVRVALVAGGVLQVGRLEPGRPEVRGGVPRLVALRRVATGVVDVAWQTGTTLQVLVADDEPPLVPLLRVSVDGTSTLPEGLTAVGEPTGLAAYGDAPLLVATRSAEGTTLYSSNSDDGYQVQLRDATRPAYPR